MSRGLGSMEKELLETLSGNHPWVGQWMRLSKVARMILLEDLSPIGGEMGVEISWLSRYSSVKRAARSLERKGLIDRDSRANQCYVRVKWTSGTGTLNTRYSAGQCPYKDQCQLQQVGILADTKQLRNLVCDGEPSECKTFLRLSKQTASDGEGGRNGDDES